MWAVVGSLWSGCTPRRRCVLCLQGGVGMNKALPLLAMACISPFQGLSKLGLAAVVPNNQNELALGALLVLHNLPAQRRKRMRR